MQTRWIALDPDAPRGSALAALQVAARRGLPLLPVSSPSNKCWRRASVFFSNGGRTAPRGSALAALQVTARRCLFLPPFLLFFAREGALRANRSRYEKNEQCNLNAQRRLYPRYFLAPPRPRRAPADSDSEAEPESDSGIRTDGDDHESRRGGLGGGVEIKAPSSFFAPPDDPPLRPVRCVLRAGEVRPVLGSNRLNLAFNFVFAACALRAAGGRGALPAQGSRGPGLRAYYNSSEGEKQA